MTDSKKFFIRLAAFVSSVCFVFALLVLAADRLCRDDYLSATIDKHQLLAQPDPKRIIFVGGSATAFGLDSPYLSQALGRKVVNMAVHGSLGLKYQLSEVEPQLRAGDILIVSPEFFNFFGSYDGDSATLLELACQNPNGLRWMSGSQTSWLLSGSPSLLQKKLKTVAVAVLKRQAGEGIYARSAFNEDGDLVSHLGKPSKKFEPSVLEIDKFDPGCIETLADTLNQIQARNVQVVVLIPAFDVAYWNKNRTAIEMLQKELHQKLKVPIVGTVESYNLPTELFFDTSWHLTKQGRELRNATIAKDLPPVLQH